MVEGTTFPKAVGRSGKMPRLLQRFRRSRLFGNGGRSDDDSVTRSLDKEMDSMEKIDSSLRPSLASSACSSPCGTDDEESEAHSCKEEDNDEDNDRYVEEDDEEDHAHDSETAHYCRYHDGEDEEEEDDDDDDDDDDDEKERGELQYDYVRDTFYFCASLVYLIHSIWDWRWEELTNIGVDLSEDNGREVPILSQYFEYDDLNSIGALLTILGVLAEFAATRYEEAQWGRCTATRRYMRGLTIYLFGSAVDLFFCLVKGPDDWSYGFLFSDYVVLLGSIVCVVLANTDFTWAPRRILTRNEDMVDLVGTVGEIVLSYADCEFFWARTPVTYSRWIMAANMFWVVECVRQLGMDVRRTIELAWPDAEDIPDHDASHRKLPVTNEGVL